MDLSLKRGLEIFEKVVCAYGVGLIFFGTFSNMMSFFVCSKLKSNKTFVFLSFLSISDIFSLYYWNLSHFFSVYFNIDIINYNYWLCKFAQFIQYASLQSSAWMLVNNY